MGVGTVSQLHSIRWAGSFDITQIEDLTPRMGTDMIFARSAGVFHPMFAAVRAHGLEVSFSTPQLATVFDIFDAADTGIAITTSDTDLHYKALSTTTGIVGSTGERLRIGDAAIVLDSVTAGHQQLAAARCRIIPIYDGTNNPVISSSQSVAGTAQAAENYMLGPVKLDTTAIDGIIDVSIDMGLTLLRKGDASEPWDRSVYLLTANPVIRIRTHNHALLTSYGPLTPTALSGAGLTVWFRHKASSGINTADGTNSHTKVVAATGTFCIDESAGSNNGPPVVTMLVYPTKSTSGTVIALSKATTIT